MGDNREQSNAPQTYEEAMMKPITLYTVLRNSFLIKGEVGQGCAQHAQGPGTWTSGRREVTKDTVNYLVNHCGVPSDHCAQKHLVVGVFRNTWWSVCLEPFTLSKCLPKERSD